MWYVMQVRSGEEETVKSYIDTLQDQDTYKKVFIPLYEEVRRSRGKNRILFKKMFPGYLFMDTERPEDFFFTLKKIPKFKRILAFRDEDDSRLFVPVGKSDEEFLDSIIYDGMMHVSYIKMKNHRYIEKVVGPLAKYRNHITKLDIPHRRAVVEAEMFGKMRRIRFGLWTDGDPEIPWLFDRMGSKEELPIDAGAIPDIGIHPGDRVTDDTGIYGDQEFRVLSVNPGRRTVYTRIDIGGVEAKLELSADQVSVIN